MGYGVNVKNLKAVYLPRQNVPWEVLVQCVGRVGRPSNGMGIVYGSVAQFNSIFAIESRQQITNNINAFAQVVYGV